jgi:hypothetical protein
MRKAAKLRLPMVKILHNRCAAPHGKIAKGDMRIKVVGKLIHNVTVWCALKVSDEYSLLSA